MSLVITVEIDDVDCEAMCNDLLDIEEWVQNAVIGKINACRKRMIRAHAGLPKQGPRIGDDRTDDDIIVAITHHADYKNRVQRDAESDLVREESYVVDVAKKLTIVENMTEEGKLKIRMNGGTVEERYQNLLSAVKANQVAVNAVVQGFRDKESDAKKKQSAKVAGPKMKRSPNSRPPDEFIVTHGA